MHPIPTEVGPAATPEQPADIPSAQQPPLDRRAILTGLLGAVGIASLAPLLRAGPLDPPAGPVSSTGKTLPDIEPRTAISAASTPGDATAVFVIAQPGNYYLTSSVSVPSGKAGIRIAASGVSVDLSGFSISGGLSPATNGVSDGGAPLVDISIRNGAVVRTAGTGISMGATSRASLSDLTVQDNSSGGVIVGNDAAIVRVCCTGNGVALPASAMGIRAGVRAVVTRCTAQSNRGSGILVGTDSRVDECLCAGNWTAGIAAGLRSQITGCVCTTNGGNGIDGGSVISACSVAENGFRGISSLNPVNIDSCASRGNQELGFLAGAGSRISDCAASLSTSSGSTGHGFNLGSSAIMTHCTAYSNAGIGISNSQDGAITDCVARRNSLDGIVSSSGRSLISDNTCTDNGTLAVGAGAGIRIAGSRCRVEGNLCAGNSAWGITAAASSNYFTRNICSQNQINWNMVSNNISGPIVDRTTPASSGMSGSGTVASTLAAADHHANFSV